MCIIDTKTNVNSIEAFASKIFRQKNVYIVNIEHSKVKVKNSEKHI